LSRFKNSHYNFNNEPGQSTRFVYEESYMSIVTLTTDFGLKDGNVGVMKGVILGISPHTKIVDLSHYISPQDIREAALILLRSAQYFPDKTVHVVVVDPGVGTARRPIAARMGSQYFVGPDNGIITLWQERLEAQGLSCNFIHLDRSKYWLPEVSHVFHGRDIFAPVAGYLASGIPMDELGTYITNPVHLDFPRPKRIERGWSCEVIHLDHFGNIATNLLYEQLEGQYIVTVRLKGVIIEGMVRTFGERNPGELINLFGSTGSLIICEVNGNAAQRLSAEVGDLVEVVTRY